MRAEFLLFVRSVQSKDVLDKIIALLEARDIEGAMRVVDSYVARMGDVLPRVAAQVGTATAAELAQVVAAGAPEIAVAVSFDPSYPRAAQIVQQHRLRFVRDFSMEQRKAAMQAFNRSFNEGVGPIETARSFRDSIGLNSTQEQAVANYRQLLINRDRQALQRDLRDRRSDATVQRAIERSRPLTERQIETMVARYRRNYLQYRAETIARTEGLQATSEAREEAVDQMMDQTGLPRSRVIDIWNTTRDKRTRDWHATMNGQRQPRGTAFVDGLQQRLRYPGDPQAPANTRINCRCQKTFTIIPAA